MENVTLTGSRQASSDEFKKTQAQLKALASISCRKCQGRGYTGIMRGTPGMVEKDRHVICACAVKNLAKARNRIAEMQLQSVIKEVKRPWWKKLLRIK